MYKDRARISAYVERHKRDRLNAYVEWQREARKDRGFSASMLIEELLDRWMAEHQEEYLAWAADNLDWLRENASCEYERVAPRVKRQTHGISTWPYA